MGPCASTIKNLEAAAADYEEAPQRGRQRKTAASRRQSSWGAGSLYRENSFKKKEGNNRRREMRASRAAGRRRGLHALAFWLRRRKPEGAGGAVRTILYDAENLRPPKDYGT